MNIFETLIISIVVMLFPILCFLFYIVANKNFDEKKEKLVLNFTFISTFYFLHKLNMNIILTFLLFTIPIFISLKKNNYISSIYLSFVPILLYFNEKYLIYYVITILFIFINYKKSNLIYILIVSTMCLIYTCINSFSIVNLIYILDFILIFNLILYTIKNGSDVICYHIEYKDLKKESEIRKSLFKITHEIKNPLAVIKAYIDLFNNDDINTFKKYVPIIKGEVDKILILLQDFLLVNKDNINLDIMDINVLLEDTINSILNLNKFNIEFDSNVDDEIFIKGDYNRLSQVITNMIKNSYEAESSKVLIKSYIENKNVIVDIIDNGTGIKSSIMDKIYEPFYTTKKDGTGLGVALSKEIVEAHDGVLKYYSNAEGTTARILLPLYN